MAVRSLRQQGYPVLEADSSRPDFDYGQWLQGAVEASSAKVLILDVRDEPPLSALRRIKDCGTLIVSVDDSSPARLLADVVFYFAVPHGLSLPWTGFSGKICMGWGWSIVGRQFLQIPASRNSAALQLLVTMGGSDPAELTLKTVRALDLLDDEFVTTVVLGPGFLGGEELGAFLSTARREYQVLQNVRDMSQVMGQADLSVASFGSTAYELATLGVPALHLCLSQDHAESASAFAKAGMAASLGVHDQVSQSDLAAAVAGLLHNPVARRKMTERGRRLIDGRGAGRIATMIMNRERRGSPSSPLGEG